MRHGVFGRKLNRDVKERKALYRALVAALVKNGKIKTTITKAKAIRGLSEKLVTSAKAKTSASLRQVVSLLPEKDLQNVLLKDIAPRFKERMGGYVRIIRIAKRKGDSTEEAYLEWTVAGKPKEVKPSEKPKQSKKEDKKPVKKGEKKEKKEVKTKQKKK